MGVYDKSEVPKQENGGGTHYLREEIGLGWELGQVFTAKERRESGCAQIHLYKLDLMYKHEANFLQFPD